MPWDLLDKWRDEDEIGSDAWVRAEISAGRSGEEHDKSRAVTHALPVPGKGVPLLLSRRTVGGGS